MAVFFCSASAYSTEEVQVHAYTSSKGFTFRNFRLTLTPQNTILASDIRLKNSGYSREASNYRYEILDERSINYTEYGQFEIFIPKDKFPLKNNANTFIIARMPQTDPTIADFEEKITKKKQLYKKIVTMVKNNKGSVEVVLEFPHANTEKIDANVFFRAYNGDYIDKVGKL